MTKVRPETRDSSGVIWGEPSTEVGKRLWAVLLSVMQCIMHLTFLKRALH